MPFWLRVLIASTRPYGLKFETDIIGLEFVI
jgi:hypothetical protein